MNNNEVTRLPFPTMKTFIAVTLSIEISCRLRVPTRL